MSDDRATATSTHAYRDDPRNATVLISVNGALVPRSEAAVSVFDSGFLLGDGVWESFRLHHGRFAFIEMHLDRLFDGARALGLEIGLPREALEARCRAATDANGMRTDVHVRLVVSRGVKATPYQDPRVTITPPTIVIIPEHKVALPEVAERGIRLALVDVRRPPQDTQDPRINSLSKHTCIQACIAAARAGADEGLMLDPHGFVSTCNSTNFFAVRGGELWTSTGEFCLPGVTRANVIRVAREAGIAVRERDFDVDDVRSADEAFVTGTFAAVTPAVALDGRPIGDGTRGPVTRRVQRLYAELLERECPPA